jgi:LuxR family maltose regulon positive regulatory protein
VASPLTLVVAPAGSGKTTLLVDWCSATSLPRSWLSLDETDRDGGQFWTAVCAALAELVDDLDEVVGSVSPPRELSEVVATLLSALDANHPATAVLVVDDLHLVDDDAAIATSLALFLGSLPEWLHVLLLSRRTPKLRVDRLRARGQLGEVHFTELIFSQDEGEELLLRLTPSLAGQDVSAAVGQAGGWAAGIQLAALAARADKAREVLTPTSARDLLFSDYIWHEVLSAEEPAIIDVLLGTCAVKRTNPALATALTGRADAGDLLLEAEARGLFVTRLGPSGWLEVHSVVRDELLAEAARRSPERLSLQHIRAARWFEDTGETTSALDHWVLGGQPREALRLLAASVASLYDTGREVTIARTITHIPLNVATSDLQAMLEFAWCHLLVDQGLFLDAVKQASATARRASATEPAQVGRLRMLESIAATVIGDWAGGAQLATQALSVLGGAGWSDQLGRFGWNMVARDIALSETWDDHSPEVEDVRLELSRDAERRVAFEGTRALGQALAGRPVDALRVAAGVRDVASVHSMTVLRAELDIAEAVAHRELGERPRAVAELVSLIGSRTGPVRHAQALAMLELTQLRLDEGDLEAVVEGFERAHEFIRRDFFGSGALGWLARTGTMVALATGQVEVAKVWSEQVGDPFWEGVSVARVQLFEGRRREAAGTLERVEPRCVRHQVVHDLLRARAADGPQEALDLAARAAADASGSGLVQTVASEGGAFVIDLLEAHPWMGSNDWLDRLRRAASPDVGMSLGDLSLPGERLTDRELEVLRILPSRLTLPEIAGELFISVNTLKFHLRVIYRKLGVGSRPEAANVARRMTSISKAVGSADPAER